MSSPANAPSMSFIIRSRTPRLRTGSGHPRWRRPHEHPRRHGLDRPLPAHSGHAAARRGGAGPQPGLDERRVRHRALLRRLDRCGPRRAAHRALRAPLRPHFLARGGMMSVAMATDITVVMRDQPGEIARVGELIASDGVHLRGLAAFTGDGHGFVHLLLDDVDVPAAKAALAREKIKIADTRDVLVVDAAGRGAVD